MVQIRVGSETEFVAIALPDDFSDEGWARGLVEVAVTGFRATIEPYLELRDLPRFLVGLEHLYASLSGRAELTPAERQFQLQLTGNGRGHVVVSGEVSDSLYENRLAFQFHADQTFLPPLIAGLRSLLHEARRAGA